MRRFRSLWLVATLLLAMALLVACTPETPSTDTTDSVGATDAPTDAPTDGTEAPAKKGCGSTLAVGLLAVLIPAAWIVLRKREA